MSVSSAVSSSPRPLKGCSGPPRAQAGRRQGEAKGPLSGREKSATDGRKCRDVNQGDVTEKSSFPEKTLSCDSKRVVTKRMGTRQRLETQRF